VRIVIWWNVSCRIINTKQRKAWPQKGRERESTLTALHSCHRTRVPDGHVLIERNCVLKHCKKREGCNKEKKDQTHHTHITTKVPFQTINKNNRKYENFVIRWNSRCRIKKTQHEGVCHTHTHRERGRESTLTANHTSHRRCIPFGHVLIEHSCPLKHCERGFNNKRKTSPPEQQKVPFQKQKIIKDVLEKCDLMILEFL
jgi:hypothetical protein